MDQFDILFITILDELDKYILSLIKDVTNLGIYLESFKIYLQQLTLTDEDKYNICMKFRHDIFKITNILNNIGRTTTFKISNRLIHIISYNTTIFNSILNYNIFYSRLPNLVTNTFNEFIKGITHFSSNTGLERPLYHRDQSCGPKIANSSYKDRNRKCILNDNIDEFNRVRLNSKNCYLERLIYDKLWKHFMSQSQNLGHGNELLRADYDYFATCYPSTVLNIDIKYESDYYPNKLVISLINPSKNIIESYNKNILTYNPVKYDTNIKCERIINDNENFIKITESKFQDFSSLNKKFNAYKQELDLIRKAYINKVKEIIQDDFDTFDSIVKGNLMSGNDKIKELKSTLTKIKADIQIIIDEYNRGIRCKKSLNL